VLAHLDELGPAFEIVLQPTERYFRHSEVRTRAAGDRGGAGGRRCRRLRQVEADQDSDLLVVGRREDSVQDLQ